MKKGHSPGSSRERNLREKGLAVRHVDAEAQHGFTRCDRVRIFEVLLDDDRRIAVGIEFDGELADGDFPYRHGPDEAQDEDEEDGGADSVGPAGRFPCFHPISVRRRRPDRQADGKDDERSKLNVIPSGTFSGDTVDIEGIDTKQLQYLHIDTGKLLYNIENSCFTFKLQVLLEIVISNCRYSSNCWPAQVYRHLVGLNMIN